MTDLLINLSIGFSDTMLSGFGLPQRAAAAFRAMRPNPLLRALLSSAANSIRAAASCPVFFSHSASANRASNWTPTNPCSRASLRTFSDCGRDNSGRSELRRTRATARSNCRRTSPFWLCWASALAASISFCCVPRLVLRQQSVDQHDTGSQFIVDCLFPTELFLKFAHLRFGISRVTFFDGEAGQGNLGFRCPLLFTGMVSKRQRFFIRLASGCKIAPVRKDVPQSVQHVRYRALIVDLLGRRFRLLVGSLRGLQIALLTRQVSQIVQRQRHSTLVFDGLVARD